MAFIKKILAAAAASNMYIHNNGLANKLRDLSQRNERWAFVGRINMLVKTTAPRFANRKSNRSKNRGKRADVFS